MEAIIYKGEIDFLQKIAECWQEEANMEDFNLKASWEGFKPTLHALANSPYTVLLVLSNEGKAVGFMGGEVFRSPVENQIMTIERFWYVFPWHRARGARVLRKSFKEWSKKTGATHYLMTASNLASDKHDRVCKIYEKDKMKKFETTYIGEL